MKFPRKKTVIEGLKEFIKKWAAREGGKMHIPMQICYTQFYSAYKENQYLNTIL